MNEYESLRRKNIEDNKRILAEIGLLNPFKPLPRVVKNTTTVQRKRGRDTSSDSPGPAKKKYIITSQDSDNSQYGSVTSPSLRRRSSRILGKEALTVEDIEEEVEAALQEDEDDVKKPPRDRPMVYGAIPGIEVGRLWESRLLCNYDGIHRPTVAGIHAGPRGAYSIALSGGYEDDVDLGDCFTYTGEGGRDLKGTASNPKNLRTAAQSKDQCRSRGNQALIDSAESQLPIRVIRGYKLRSAFSPEEGYRYDGLYKLDRWWYTTGMAGFGVFKFALKRLPDQAPPPWTFTEECTSSQLSDSQGSGMETHEMSCVLSDATCDDKQNNNEVKVETMEVNTAAASDLDKDLPSTHQASADPGLKTMKPEMPHLEVTSDNSGNVGPADELGVGSVDEGSVGRAVEDNLEPVDKVSVGPVDDAGVGSVDKVSVGPFGEGPVDDAGVGPVDDADVGPVDDAGVGPVDDADVGPVDDADSGPVDEVSVGPVDDADVGPVDAGVGPADDADIGPADEVSVGPVDKVSVGPAGEVSEGPVDDAGEGSVDKVRIGPAGEVSEGPVDDAGVGSVDKVSVGPVDEVCAGSVDDAGVGPVDDAGVGPDAGAGPADDAGVGPADDAGVGPDADAGVGPVADAGVGPADDAGVGPADDAGVEPVDEVNIGPADEVCVVPTDKDTVDPADKRLVRHDDKSNVVPVDKGENCGLSATAPSTQDDCYVANENRDPNEDQEHLTSPVERQESSPVNDENCNGNGTISQHNTAVGV